MKHTTRSRNVAFVLSSLGISLLIAAVLSPFASQNPDGLDRVAQDQGFTEKASADPPAQKLPFYQVFEEYSARGLPEPIATPIAGIAGTLVTFGLAWGAGKLLVRKPDPRSDEQSIQESD